MKALLLAAGEGTRLRPLTLDRPKPMVEVAGEPAVAHSLRWLRRQGVTEVAINLHHHPRILQDFVGDGSRFGLTVTYSIEREILGTAGALRPLLQFFQGEDPFLVLYGDVLTNIDLQEILDSHESGEADATIVLTPADDPTRAGIVSFDAEHWITRFVEKPKAGEVFSDWANAGVYLCGPTVLGYVAVRGQQDFGRDLFPAMLDDGRRLLASPTEAMVIDFGSRERLGIAAEALRTGQAC